MNVDTINAKVKNIGLSAPWYEMQRKISYTLGTAATVLVSDVKDDGLNYSLTVTCYIPAVAKALSNIIKLEHDFGGARLKIWVKDMNGQIFEPNAQINKEIVEKALSNNPLIYNVEGRGDNVAILCFPSIVKFWNDDISNPAGFTYKMVNEVFKEVLSEKLAIYMLPSEVANL